MSRRLIIRPAAEQDLTEVRDWYEAQRPGLGDEFVTAVDERFQQISDFPESYAVEHRGVRGALLHRFPYVVYFRILERDVEVLAVLHGSRNPRIWRSRA